MVKFLQRTVKGERLQELYEFKVGSWIYVESPTDAELDQLVAEFPLDRGLLGDALDPNEVPRIEREDGVVYIFTRAPVTDDAQRTVTAPVLIAIGKDFLLTAAPRPIPFLEKFVRGTADFYTTQKSKLFTQFISELNSSYTASLNSISRSVRSMSAHPDRVSNQDIFQFVMYENVLNDFLAALVPTNGMLQQILSGKLFKLYEEDHELTEDAFLANGQLIESAKSNLKTIVNIRDAFSTVMTNNLNRVIKLLTALTVVLMVPNIVAGFYGMNVPLPFSNSPMAFFGVVLFTVLLSVLILGVFVRNRWL